MDKIVDLKGSPALVEKNDRYSPEPVGRDRKPVKISEQASWPGLSGRLDFIATFSAFVRLTKYACVRTHAECNVIRIMGYTRAASRLHSCTVGACTHMRAIGVTLPFPARPAIPAIMLAIKDNDVSRGLQAAPRSRSRSFITAAINAAVKQRRQPVLSWSASFLPRCSSDASDFTSDDEEPGLLRLSDCGHDPEEGLEGDLETQRSYRQLRGYKARYRSSSKKPRDEGNKWFEEPAETGPRTKDTLPAPSEPPSSNSRGEKEGEEEEEEKEESHRNSARREGVRMGERLTQEEEKDRGDSNGRGRKVTVLSMAVYSRCLVVMIQNRPTERFKVDLSSCECKLGISRGGPCGNKITRPHSSLKWHSRGRQYNSLHPGSSSTSHCSFGSLFIFTNAIYVAKINDWRKRVSDDTLLKIQPQAAVLHQERCLTNRVTYGDIVSNQFHVPARIIHHLAVSVVDSSGSV
ncbi:hypothetical protein G5I_01978 [Acromyrmex echinatior]|uniref:Uncharacterized protein n=1 Tax=Acromyrmex echinatior TaxID=103372 RepID=F4W931_ACREC|nr:hypothetical protein G5I_01978 [Acromyrmex echinatior]